MKRLFLETQVIEIYGQGAQMIGLAITAGFIEQ